MLQSEDITHLNTNLNKAYCGPYALQCGLLLWSTTCWSSACLPCAYGWAVLTEVRLPFSSLPTDCAASVLLSVFVLDPKLHDSLEINYEHSGAPSQDTGRLCRPSLVSVTSGHPLLRCLHIPVSICLHMGSSFVCLPWNPTCHSYRDPHDCTLGLGQTPPIQSLHLPTFGQPRSHS